MLKPRLRLREQALSAITTPAKSIASSTIHRVDRDSAAASPSRSTLHHFHRCSHLTSPFYPSSRGVSPTLSTTQKGRPATGRPFLLWEAAPTEAKPSELSGARVCSTSCPVKKVFHLLSSLAKSILYRFFYRSGRFSLGFFGSPLPSPSRTFRNPPPTRPLPPASPAATAGRATPPASLHPHFTDRLLRAGCEGIEPAGDRRRLALSSIPIDSGSEAGSIWIRSESKSGFNRRLRQITSGTAFWLQRLCYTSATRNRPENPTTHQTFVSRRSLS